MPNGKSKKVTGLIKDELGEKIMTKFIGFRAKTYNYLIDYANEDKRAKGTKMCVIKSEIKLENYEKKQLN